MKTVPTKVSVGMKFTAAYADSNSMWIVRKSLGKSWLCEIIDEEGKGMCDWVGTQKAFLPREILGSLRMSAMWQGIQDENEQFLQSQPEGAILHYHNSQGSYVRRQVVIKDGRRYLKDIALVGNWDAHDLPKRREDGSVYMPYHPQQILEGKLNDHLQVSTTYEHPSFVKPGTHRGANLIDPRKLAPISLELPEETPEQKETARQWILIASVQSALNDIPEIGPDTPMNRLRLAHAILNNEFKK